MTVILWLDMHFQAMTALSSFIAAVAAIGSWVCTVWSDYKSRLRSEDSDQKIDSLSRKLGT